ncbi:MAG TPA: DUF1326 domain-containing protein [Gaiellales bacterium]
MSAAERAAMWRIAGTYLEVCNCDAICPCRRIDGAAGGRSTYGVCTGALSWRIVEGEVGDLDLSSLHVVIVSYYSDDEPGSPWSWVLHVDERADAGRRAAIADIFSGRLGGTPLRQFPWAFKPSTLLASVPSRIEIDHTPGRGWFRAGATVDVRVARAFETQSPVSCIIPGHHRTGREVVADVFDVREPYDERFRFSYSGRCGYEATFEYSSAGLP